MKTNRGSSYDPRQVIADINGLKNQINDADHGEFGEGVIHTGKEKNQDDKE
jgi:hypothetical protein